jgi:hypothetical protein
MLFLPMVKMATLVSFQIHQAEIAAQLCQYRYEAENGCQGHCYLRRQLEKQEKTNQALLESIKSINVDFCFQDQLQIEGEPTLFLTFSLENRPPFFYQFSVITGDLDCTFRPPIA